MTRRYLGRVALVLGAATLCAMTATLPTPAAADEAKPSATKYAPLAEGVASFGAATEGDWLYVYGGHTGKTHSYSKQQVSAQFQRMNLKTGGEWEALPSGPALQGLVLLADGGLVYRIGGMTAVNEAGQPDDLHSLSDVARFDPKSKKWTSLTALPEGRSSHGAAIIDHKLYVLGGWCLGGSGKAGAWSQDALVLDLTADKGEWKVLPKQPFQRRAMTVTELDGKLYVTGGLVAMGGISMEVDVYDVKSQVWSKGPKIPGMNMNGNGLAACSTDKAFYISGMDGKVYQLNAAKDGWDVVGQLAQSRIHHRLLPFRQGVVLAVAGANSSGNLKSVDLVQVEDKH